MCPLAHYSISTRLHGLFSSFSTQTMPRHCRSCGSSHEKPTGKHCRRQASLPDSVQDTDQVGDKGEVLSLLQTMQSQMMNMQQRLEAVEGSGEGATPQQRSPGPERIPDDNLRHTPTSVRANRATMEAVNDRLAEMGLEEQWQDAAQTMAAWRQGARKSGAITKGTDKVKQVIDWPHFYIRQGPRKTTPTFEELSANEFTLGFLRMIRDPASTLDMDRMLEILTEVMEDTIDFSWENARTYYNMVAQDIEQNRLQWSDRQGISRHRMSYSRVVLPQQQPQTQKSAAPAKAKCCAPFQKGTCDKGSDHAGFKHACEFCYRTKASLFPHPEEQCRSKKFATSKNVQKGDKE